MVPPDREKLPPTPPLPIVPAPPICSVLPAPQVTSAKAPPLVRFTVVDAIEPEPPNASVPPETVVVPV